VGASATVALRAGSRTSQEGAWLANTSRDERPDKTIAAHRPRTVFLEELVGGLAFLRGLVAGGLSGSSARSWPNRTTNGPNHAATWAARYSPVAARPQKRRRMLLVMLD
jgi:hypothetical protein